MKVSIITIGDEILIGQIIDTNSAWIAQRLNEIGLRVEKVYSISDTEEAILRTLERASEIADIVLITGGLGPTRDDITKTTLAKYFDDVSVVLIMIIFLLEFRLPDTIREKVEQKVKEIE